MTIPNVPPSTELLLPDPNGWFRLTTQAYFWREDADTDGTVRLSRDAMGRITQGTRVDMSVIGVAYDVLGNPTSITPPSRPSYTMSSDFRGNLLTMVTPGGTQESYVLDLDHRLTSATKGDGRGWSVTYDSSDRVGPLPVRQASTGAVNGELTWTFEDETLSLGSMSINGHVVDYSYDRDGLPLHIGAQSLAYQNGTYFLREREVGNASVTYAYSDFGELNDLRVRAGGELFRVRYTRDDSGRITEAQETNQGTTTTYAYTYDLLGQITEVRVNGTLHATYGYDANSNRVQVNSPTETVTSGQVVLNDDDQLTRYGNAFYQFNSAGQRTQKEVGTSVTRYTYGVLGELQRVELPDGRVVTYQYDALKRRIGRQVNGSTTERWLWGGAPGPVAEVDASGNTLTTYVYGTGINAPDYMVRGAEIYALIRDHVGSIRFVLNIADNAIAQELRYDTFGQVVLDTNPGFQPFGYAGGLYDPDTELTRFGARDYDAHTGRWTARDPIAFAGGQSNLYVYVGNDPINFVDPNVLIGGAMQGALTKHLNLSNCLDSPSRHGARMDVLFMGAMSTILAIPGAMIPGVLNGLVASLGSATSGHSWTYCSSDSQKKTFQLTGRFRPTEVVLKKQWIGKHLEVIDV